MVPLLREGYDKTNAAGTKTTIDKVSLGRLYGYYFVFIAILQLSFYIYSAWYSGPMCMCTILYSVELIGLSQAKSQLSSGAG
jgi:hypothetical protein